ncbi:hypothetical protein BH23THE1_BH23THE1_00390 [soil metagenome]
MRINANVDTKIDITRLKISFSRELGKIKIKLIKS